MSNIIMELKGTNGTITAYDDRAIISRKGFLAWATQGFKGDKVYFYTQLSGIEYRKPGLINGYIKFITAGTKETNAKVNLFTSSKESVEDENTVILKAFNPNIPKQSEQLYNLLIKKINEAKTPNLSTHETSNSKADELLKFKHLLDMGAITKQEFEQEKRKLLD